MLETKEITPITKELLERTKSLKEGIRNNNVIGAEKIIEGIELFENTIQTLNVNLINSEIVEFIKTKVGDAMRKIEEESQRINHRIIEGIKYCYFILEVMNKDKESQLVRRKTLK